jgi:anti-sigma regulatory factor (Ser/Thr protein kinase)
MAESFRRVLRAEAARLPALLDEIEQWLARSGVPAAASASIMIASDEILSNVVNHGGGSIEIDGAVEPSAVRIAVADDGPAFDPLARPAPDTSLDIDERAIGGLGIHLVREMMDGVAYRREAGRNRLTFHKTF